MMKVDRLHKPPWWLTVLLLVGLMTAACSGSDPQPEVSDASMTPRPTASAKRGITTPKRLILTNSAFGRSRARVAVAIEDLKAVGYWSDLTGHLYELKIGSRLGLQNVPEDGHLADAYLTAKIDGDEGGSYCDIMFFPAAMSADLERWRNYHASGLLDDPAPSFRQFWAAILGHELAHCQRGRNGETAALKWEDRVLAAVREAGLE
jgi:hypothetical protein